MKKSILTLMSQAELSGDGQVKAGFLRIKGGASLLEVSNNASCSNTGVCGGTNTDSCTNSKDCTKSTNDTPYACTNSGTCFM